MPLVNNEVMSIVGNIELTLRIKLYKPSFVRKDIV